MEIYITLLKISSNIYKYINMNISRNMIYTFDTLKFRQETENEIDTMTIIHFANWSFTSSIDVAYFRFHFPRQHIISLELTMTMTIDIVKNYFFIHSILLMYYLFVLHFKILKLTNQII